MSKIDSKKTLENQKIRDTLINSYFILEEKLNSINDKIDKIDSELQDTEGNIKKGL